MEIDLSQFHQTFFEESLEGLDIMEEKLLNLETDSDSETINTIFRSAHSIKGGSATFNFKQIAEFTHVMETLLDEMRAGEREVSRGIIDLLLKSVDCLRNMLVCTQNGDEAGDSHVSLLEQFNQLLDEEPVDSVVSKTEKSPSEHLGSIWKINFRPKSYILETGNDPVRIFRELKTYGHLESFADLTEVPDFDELKPESCHIFWQLTLDADVDVDDIKEVFEWVEDDCELNISSDQTLSDSASLDNVLSESISSDNVSSDSVSSKNNDLAEQNENLVEDSSIKNEKQIITTKNSQKMADIKPKKTSSEKPVSATSSTSIRVGIDKVDTLIDLVGELVITQSMLSELGENFEVSKLNQLVTGLNELEQNTRELQESVMRIRMLPIGFIFNRLPRMIRDLSSKLNKKVNLHITGESTELDKTVMEQIGDPLTHLVRNALDHGLETTEKRLASNKPEEGNLTINAFHQGGNIVIEVTDDGGGIDPDIIYHKAIDKGLINADSELPREQIISLIMEPGFSTAAVISDVSGRGVGLDVVKRNINNLGGNVEIDSVLNEGTTFIIRLPLTLAILDGQLIKVGNEVYVLPLVSIIESVPISMADTSRIAGDMLVYKLGSDYIPVIDLHKEFEIVQQETSLNSGLLAIVEGENRKIALHIDELLGQQQVVIKSLESHYKAIQGVSGATILGDGRVSLILDIVGMAKRAIDKNSQQKKSVA